MVGSIQMHQQGSFSTVSSGKVPSTPMSEGPKVFEQFLDSKIAVPVHIKSQEREERLASLQIDISLKAVNSTHHQTLLIEITEDSDPCFLYVMECGESEFHILKDEQKILVDFLVFPHMLLELLRKCEAPLEYGSRFICAIAKNQTEALLHIIEVNNFKQLVHISLKLRQGQNEMLLRHLSKNLTKMKDESLSLSERIRELESGLEDQNRTCDALQEQCARLKSEKDMFEKQAEFNLKTKVNEVKEQMMEQFQFKSHQADSEKTRLIEKYDSRVEDLETQLKDVNAKYARLAEAKTDLDSLYSDLTKAHRQMEHDLEIATSQLDPLRAGNLKLNSTQISQERTITELTLKIQNYEQQLKDKEGIIEKLNVLTTSMTEQKTQREEELTYVRAAKQKLEDKIAQSIQEINRGNQIIEKLQSNSKAKREKLHLKNAVVLQQEEVINKKQSQIDDCEREKYNLQREISHKDDHIRELERSVEDWKRKLEDAHRQLEESRAQISYLNKEANKVRTVQPVSYAATSKPPTPSPYGSSFKPSGYSVEALRATPTRSQLMSSADVPTPDPEPVARMKDPVKYKEPVV